MNIIALEVQSILKLEAIRIEANGKNVTLSGKNASGKTSVLRCIEMALGGEKIAAEEPVHKEAEKGKIILNLGDIVVTRTFTKAGGTTLNVTAKDGLKYPSPQAVLDGLVGKLTFDPLEFSRLKPKVQSETLRKLVGLDFGKLDGERQAVYDKRRDVNRDVDRAKTLLASRTYYPDAPAKELAAADIISEIEKAQTHNAKKQVLVSHAMETERGLNQRESVVRAGKEQIERMEKEVLALKSQIEERKRYLLGQEEEAKRFEGLADAADEAVAAFKIIDTDPFKEKMASIEDVNRKVRANAAYQEAAAAVKAKTAELEKLTDRLQAIDGEKQEALASAKFPVEGLSFTEAGIVFNGLPFEQASAAEQLRISVSIGMALNPKLKIIMIREGSLIDSDGMKVLSALTDEKGFQLFIERVSDAKELTVIIEDGEDK